MKEEEKGMKTVFEKVFQLSKHKTTAKTEIMAGITTFMTMAYILAVNPSILSAAGMDSTAVLLATALSSFIGTACMGLMANLPFALSAGMGLNIAQGSAVLGMIYLQRKNAAAQEVNVPSCISCYLGVTEPAMFGVNLKFHFPFICGMIGSAIAAVVCVATSTTANAIGVGGIPGILSIQPAYMLSFALCMAIAIVVPFVLTVIVGKKKGVA